MRLINLLLIALLLSNSACATIPVKDYTVIKWLPVSGSCFERLLPNDQIEKMCIDDDSDMIGISLSDYIKELNYQNILIKSCKKFK